MAGEANYLRGDNIAARYGNVPSLDGIRAVSVLLVMLSHFVSAKLFPGSLGVYIFFVLSGFLIARLLIAEDKHVGRVNLGAFYARRAIRLYPVVIVYTALVVGVYLVRGSPINWPEPLGALFYFENYVYAPLPQSGAHEAMPFEPLWSLSVEEHFYFLLPGLMMFLKGRPRALLGAMIAVCVVCLGYRLYMAWSDPALLDTRFFYVRTECRIDSLAFGVALAALCEIPGGRRWLARLANPATLALAGALILFTLLYREQFFRETVRYSIQGGAIALGIVAVVFRGGALATLLNLAPMVFVGRLSYSLYVWSIGVPPLVAFVLPGHGPIQILLSFALAFALAVSSYYGLEKPFLALRKRFAAGKPPKEPAYVGGTPA